MAISRKPMSEHIYSISELTRDIKILLETKFPVIRVEGEISNFRQSQVGHAYFTLKDDFAQITAVLFKSTYISKKIQLKDGIKVIATGTISVYEQRGAYQLIVSKIEEKGIGELQLAFERLKRKLYEEGFFDEAHKKKIPPVPRKIGIVTSPTGAAIRDILHVLNRRFSNLHIILNPTKVQGDEAASEIANAIEEFNAMKNVDVIIIGRGGGSLEDLWCFNEEIVARAIYCSEIPIISAVGHEIDYTISDFVADLRAPTPSAAAELVIGAKGDISAKITHVVTRLISVMQGTLHEMQSRYRLAVQSYVFREPMNLVRQYQQLLDEYLHRMTLHSKHTIDSLKQKLEGLRRHLGTIDPRAVLSRGYSITLDDKDSVVKDSGGLIPNQKVKTILHKGEFTSRVETIK